MDVLYGCLICAGIGAIVDLLSQMRRERSRS